MAVYTRAIPDNARAPETCMKKSENILKKSMRDRNRNPNTKGSFIDFDPDVDAKIRGMITRSGGLPKKKVVQACIEYADKYLWRRPAHIDPAGPGPEGQWLNEKYKS